MIEHIEHYKNNPSMRRYIFLLSTHQIAPELRPGKQPLAAAVEGLGDGHIESRLRVIFLRMMT
jgi:hypothetical protein